MKLVDYAFTLDGPDDAPPLLLVHGLLSNRSHWLPNLPRLSRHFRTVRIELPAHGDTLLPENSAALSPDRLVDALDLLRDRLGFDSWLICGQSVGAAITLRYALAYPHRVTAQIFTNANAVLREYPGELELEAHAQRVARLRDPAHAPFDRETIHPRLAKRFPASIRSLLIKGVEAMKPDSFATFIDAVMPHISLRYQLSRTGVPTCLINGRFERRFQPLREWAAAEIPGIEIYDLDGGHSVNIEAAEAFDVAAVSFLERHSAHRYTHI